MLPEGTEIARVHLVLPDDYEPLCTPEQWAAVQAMMQKGPTPKGWHATSD